MRTLSARELNRALLERQLLLRRRKLPIPTALERMGGLQAQYAPSMYIGLWTRLEGFRRDSLTRALDRGTVVQGTLLRVTIHLVSRADYWRWTAAIRAGRRRAWLTPARQRRPDSPTEREWVSIARKVERKLREGPLGRRELGEFAGLAGDSFYGINLWLDLVRMPPSGTWERRRADLYGLASEWIGPDDGGPETGLDLLVRRYLGAFGPATRNELADWLGLRVGDVAPALERAGLRRFRAEDGAELLDLPRAPLPDPDTPAPVRFLPTWDAILLAHARRALVVREEDRPRIFNSKNPQSLGTFLVDGQVAGAWSYADGRIAVDPFRRLTKAERSELDDEAERLAAFHA